MLQISGRAPKISESLSLKIKKITQTLHFDSYVSLTCHNCPDVVQALNILAVLNPNITHTMIEGGMFQKKSMIKNHGSANCVFKWRRI